MDYELRHHPRARRLKLRVERDGALVVTAPARTPRRLIDRFVDSRKGWIEAARGRLESERGERPVEACGARPTLVELPAIEERWTIDYARDREPGRCRTDVGSRTLSLSALETDAQVAGLLRHWLKRRAREALTPWVETLATRHGIRYARLSFRNQKTRWGSCSSTGTVSLNARLLFASSAVCRYVLIHELAHVRHPDHSSAFWRHVAAMEPDYRMLDRQLRSVWQRLPDWV